MKTLVSGMFEVAKAFCSVVAGTLLIILLVGGVIAIPLGLATLIDAGLWWVVVVILLAVWITAGLIAGLTRHRS